MAEKVGLQAILDLQNWSKNVTKYTGDLSKMDKASSGFGSKVSSHFAGVGKAIAGVGLAIGAASVAAGAAVGAFVASGISKAADLEAQMSSIAAVLNTTAEGVKPLKDLIMDLALDPNLVVTTNEAADAIENLAKNGLSMDQIMAGAARSTVLLANATGADFGMAADIASDAMAIFNIKAEDMGQAVDGITGVTNASKFTIDDYRLAIAQAGAVANLVGVEFDDFNTTIAAISPNFASGSDAGTSLKTFLLSLIPTTTKAEEAFSELNLVSFDQTRAMEMLAANGIKPLSNSYEDIHKAIQGFFEDSHNVSLTSAEGIEKFGKWMMETKLLKNEFFDANGQLKDMSEITTILHEATKDLSEEEKNLMMETMFGTDAMRAAAGVADSGAVAYRTAAQAAKALGVSIDDAAKFAEGGITKFEAMELSIAKIDAEEQAATRMKNFRGVLQILQGAIEALQIKIGDVFLPVLTKLGEMANNLISAYGPALVKPFEDFGAALGRVFEAITTAKTPMEGFVGALNSIGLNGTAIATQIGAVAFGIGAVGFAIGIVLQPIADFILKFVEWKDVAIALAGILAYTLAPAVGVLVAAVWGLVWPIAGTILAVAALRTAWENDFLGIQTKTHAAIDGTITDIQALITAIQTNGPAALREIQAFASGNQTEFTNLGIIWEAAKTSISELFTGAIDTSGSKLPEWKAQLEQWATAAGSWLLSASGAVPAILVTWYDALSAALTAKLETWRTAFTEWSTIAGQWLTDASATVGTQLAAWYQSLSSELALKLELWKTAFALWIPEAWAWLVKAGTEAATQVGLWYTALSGAVTTKLETWKTALTPWIAETWAWLVKAAGDAVTEFGKWYTALSGEVTAKLEEWKTAFDDWAADMWGWLTKAAGEASTKFGEWYTELSGAVTDKLETWKTALDDWAAELSDWILTAVPETVSKLGLWYQAMKVSLTAKLQTLKTDMLKWGGGLVGWILDVSANPVANLGKWLDKFIAWIPTGLVELAAGMLRMGTALISWVGVSAKDVGPEMGKWLGKVLAWIPLGVLMLGRGVIKLGSALVGWIAGGGGVPVSDSAKGKLDAEFEKFKGAIGPALLDLWEGIKGFVQGFGQSFWDELGKHIDWIALGSAITGGIQSGVEMTLATLTGVFTTLAHDAYMIVWDTDWIDLGRDIINFIKSGVAQLASNIVSEMGRIAKEALAAFLGVDWVGLGKSVIDGIVSGLKKNATDVIDFLTSLAGDAIGAAMDKLQGKSPSKEFEKIGGYIIAGWVIGMENGRRALLSSVESLASAVVKTATKAGAGAASALASSMSNWQKLGGARLDEVGKDTPSGLQFTKQSDLLKQQQNLVDLVKTIGDVGGDVGGMLSRFIQGNQLVVSAEAQVDLATRMMDTLTKRLNRTLYLAATGFTQQAQRVEATATEALDGFGDTAKQKVAELTKTIYNPDASAGSSQQALRNLADFAVALERIKKEIAFFQNRRVSAQSVIEAITGSDVSKLDQFKLGIAGIDTQIADLQKRMMETGDTSLLGDLRKLDGQRAGMINDLQTFVLTVEQIKQSVAEMAKYRPSVDAVVKSMSGDENKIEQFKNIVAGLDAQIATLQNRMVETGDRSLLKELGVLDLKRSGALDDLRNYITTVERLEIEFANLEAFRPDVENIINKQDVTRLDQFKDGIAEIDEKIAAMQKTILETGDTSLLGNLRGLDAQRGRMVVDLQTFIQQTEALNREIADLQKRRPSFEDILVPPAQIGQLDEYQMALANIDEQIGRLEERIKTTGDRGLLARLAGLDQQRTQVISRINVYTDSLKALDRQLEFLAKQRFDADTIIDDLTSEFDQIEHFKNGIAALDEQIASMEERIKASGDWSLVPGLQTLDAKRSLITSDLRSFLMQAKQAEQAVEGFGETAQAHMQAILQNIYATPALGGNRTNALRDFNNFVNQLFSIRSQLDRRAPKMDVGGLIDRATSQFDQMTSFEQMIGSIDSQAEQLQNRILETGDQGLLSQLFGMDAQRARLEGDLQRFIVQFSNMEDQMRRIKAAGEAGQTSIEAFISEQIKPIQDAFSQPMRDVDRDAWLITMQRRVEFANRFIDQMRVVEKMQQSIANVPGFENLADEFATLQDINIPESTRLALMRNVQAFIEQMKAVQDLEQSIVNVPGFDTLADEFSVLKDFDMPESARINLQRMVQTYIAQIKQFQAAQRDVSIGAGADPLAGRFKTERLDAIEEKLRDINLAEAERARLIAQYTADQEKMLQIQQKQQQLTFLQEQLSLLEKLRSIDDEEDYAINVQNILGGIKFGIGASMDDLLALTGRTIDELVKFTNWKLGIHSPSRVFAEIGAYMMQGLGQGIERMAMVPMRSMAMAVSNVAQSPLINRSVNINMGGVTVANGMDETMFRAMIRQEVGMML